MEAAVLPDEEDIGAPTAEQPQSSHGAPRSCGDADQYTAARQPALHSASQRVAEQPRSSSSAGQLQAEAAQRTAYVAAPAQWLPLPRDPERITASHGNVQVCPAAISTVPPAPAASPDLLVRPFQTLLSTPERDAHLVRSQGVPHQLHSHQVVPEYVWVDGIGAIERVKPPQAVGALNQRLAAAAPLMDSNAAVAHQPQQAAPAPRKPLVRAVPDLCTMQDVPEFWRTWQEGNGMEQAALKDLPAELIRPQKQRYSEWSKAARALEGQAQEMHVTPEQMAVRLDAARMGQGRNVASYVKALGSQWLAKQRAAANAAAAAALQAADLQE